MHFTDTVPLIEITRGAIVEILHRGAVAVVDTQGKLLYAAGNPDLTTYLRSTAKPIQLLPTVEAGAVARFGLEPHEISMMCASHSGEPFHLDTVRRILQKIGLTEAALQCGPHLPGHLPTQREMLRRGEEPVPIHSNCSGKHTGMLTLCQLKGFPTDGYLALTHPVQQRILQTLAELAQMRQQDIGISIDGCGVPTFALPIQKIGLLFAQLAQPSQLSDTRQHALDRIRTAMMTCPEHMSGNGRFCAALMRQFPGEVVLKSGAAGVYGVGLPKHGIGVGLKIEDGLAEPRYATILAVLHQLDLLPRDGLATLWEAFCPPVRNFRGEVVGEIRSVLKMQSR